MARRESSTKTTTFNVENFLAEPYEFKDETGEPCRIEVQSWQPEGQRYGAPKLYISRWGGRDWRNVAKIPVSVAVALAIGPEPVQKAASRALNWWLDKYDDGPDRPAPKKAQSSESNGLVSRMDALESSIGSIAAALAKLAGDDAPSKRSRKARASE